MSSRQNCLWHWRVVWTTVLLGSVMQPALALEMYPPWVNRSCVKPKTPAAPPWIGCECSKPKSPYYPPWIGTNCHKAETPSDGVWAYPQDWRDVDWSQADSGAALHMSTQAVSLKVDAHLRGDKPVKAQPPILEYYRYPAAAIPGRIPYPK